MSAQTPAHRGAARPSILPGRRFSSTFNRHSISSPKIDLEHSSATDFYFERRCVLWVHDELSSKEEVIFNHALLPGGKLEDGHLMSIALPKSEAAPKEAVDKAGAKSDNGSSNLRFDTSSMLSKSDSIDVDAEKQYLFVPKEMPKEVLAKQPKLEISVAKHIADAFGFKHRTDVIVTSCRTAAVSASHVELSFRDVYMARSDMWRFTLSELSNKTIYKGQKIVYMGTIKAQITSIYLAGRKVQSAFFSVNTKPIFRSASARYVLFVQMSREMWDFDSEGSGEIMFTKVVNGFLPALFKRWVTLKARHLVSIVLFTRVEYDTGIVQDIKGDQEPDDYFSGYQSDGNRKPYKDFYRVVVSEMASGEWTNILFQLKQEFRLFRHDITMFRLNNFVKTYTPPEIDFALGALPGTKIEAEPTFAIHGNLLEAINLAASRFSADHIDRDLVRTGISIVILTPGPGLFEVEYEKLRSTTDSLIGSGIGIDLVCLPKIPLHSVPLFRYRNPLYATYQENFRKNSMTSDAATPRQPGTVVGSYSAIQESLSPSKPLSLELQRRLNNLMKQQPPNQYSYAIPHWLDVSFWTGASQELLSRNAGAVMAKDHRHRKGIVKPRKSFQVRCKMYEVEMLGQVDNTEISVPLLPEHIRRLGKTSGSEKGTLVKKPVKPFSCVGDSRYGRSRGVISNRSTKEKDYFAMLDALDRETAVIPKREAIKIESRLPSRGKKEKSSPVKQLAVNGETKLRPSLEGKSSTDVEPSKTSSPVIAPTPKSDDAALVKAASSSKTMKPPSSTPPKSSIAVRPFRMSRHISFGFKGFGISAPKASTATVQKESASAAPTLSKTSGTATAALSTPSKSGSTAMSHLLLTPRMEAVDRPKSSAGSVRSRTDSLRSEDTDKSNSRPIAIRGTSHPVEPVAHKEVRSMLGSAFAGTDIKNMPDAHAPSLQTIVSDDTIRTVKSKLLAANVPTNTAINAAAAPSPWLKVLNPSNPTEANNAASQYKRWQHIFPKPVVTKAMKWRSLCSPAAVPLTTEYFPTKFQLDSEYQQKPYNISQDLDDDLMEVPKTREEFLRELISVRLSQGFQIVIGPAVGEAFGQKVMKIANAFDSSHISEDGTSIFLTMGNLIHQLSCVNGTEIEINMFERKSALPALSPSEMMKGYKPAIKTHFDNDYVSGTVHLPHPRNEYNWNYVDSYIAGHEEDMTDRLRYWRARFVLIPVERPNLPNRPNVEDTEEETRLEGIKALTQIWQRHRYMSPSERRFQSASARKMKDPNPLDIWYQTQDPSVVIAAELEGLPILETVDGLTRRQQLVYETDRFRRANLDIKALAEAMQEPPEKGGIRMQNRRWHFRLHHNCFIGSDMTTWLMENFEDIDTRDEAVEFGNKLMGNQDDEKKPGEQSADKDKSKDVALFVHVEKRHQFRDGQYFYQISSAYAKPRETRTGWPFAPRKKEASLPGTPMTEPHARESPRPETTRSHAPSASGSNITINVSDTGKRDSLSVSGTSTPTSSTHKKPKVVLSNCMKYDVDPRKRSYRPERISLHYDRIHNPDSCYHIRLDWLNVTAKLIEDAISMWAVTAERYGLSLVEVPLSEACDIEAQNPFRRPYEVKLALRPPNSQPALDYDAGSFVPNATASTQKDFYQKAILKKFGFVLDMEAASNYPPNVDVSYSWGRPEYKYSQYIHRNGKILVQVNENGDFIITSNKMINNRAPQIRLADFTASQKEQGQKEQARNRNPDDLLGQTPAPSPMVKPTIPVIPSPSLLAVRASPVTRPSMSHSTNSFFNAKERANDAYAVKEDFEAFCSSIDTLRAFYTEVQNRVRESMASVVSTPATGALCAERGLDIVEESSIPVLGLGPSRFMSVIGGGDGAGAGGLSSTWAGGGFVPPTREGREFGSLRQMPFRRGSEHASDSGSVGTGSGGGAVGSPLALPSREVEGGSSKGSLNGRS